MLLATPSSTTELGDPELWLRGQAVEQVERHGDRLDARRRPGRPLRRCRLLAHLDSLAPLAPPPVRSAGKGVTEPMPVRSPKAQGASRSRRRSRARRPAHSTCSRMCPAASTGLRRRSAAATARCCSLGCLHVLGPIGDDRAIGLRYGGDLADQGGEARVPRGVGDVVVEVGVGRELLGGRSMVQLAQSVAALVEEVGEHGGHPSRREPGRLRLQQPPYS